MFCKQNSRKPSKDFAETLYSPKQKRTITTLAKHAPFSSTACLLNSLQAVCMCLLLFWGGNASKKSAQESHLLIGCKVLFLQQLIRGLELAACFVIRFRISVPLLRLRERKRASQQNIIKGSGGPGAFWIFLFSYNWVVMGLCGACFLLDRGF